MASIELLNNISLYFSIYIGLSILIAGVIGNCLNILVFLSLKTFRRNSCAFYLTIMSCLNIGQLLTSLLPRIVNLWFTIDWTVLSLCYCKLRIYLYQVCALTSFTCMCLATIDQFLATCSHIRWQRFSNIKIAYRLIILSLLFWILHGIPLLIYQDLVLTSSIINDYTCTSINKQYQSYLMYGFSLILVSSLPIFITTIFGLLAYQNVKQLSHRAVPLVRRETDKQLTIMVLVQNTLNFCFILPFIIVTILNLTLTYNRDSINYARLQLARSITVTCFYFYYASSFYIYICVSERYRKQFLHVLFGIYIKHRRRPRRMTINPLTPFN